MGLAPISSSTTTSTTESSSTTALSDLGEDYTRFLTLLTAQVQYQDPMEPMDSTQFVSQLAQLSQVEQAVQTNSNLETVTGQMASLLSVSGASILGRDITYASSEFTLEDGVSDAYYGVADGTASVTANIIDPDGNVIRTMEGLSTDSSQVQALDWDGLDDSGNAVLDGTYTLSLTAYDADGETLTSETYRQSTVTEVLFSEGQNYYRTDGDETIPAEDVLAAS